MERCSKSFIPVILAGLLLSGCMPAGPRSLLEGERLIKKGHYALAIQKLRGAVELLPQNAQAWNHLGLAYHGAGQWTNAIKAYEHALVLSNNLAAARYNLGCVHLEQNNTTAAAEEFKRFTLLQSASPEGWLKLAAAQLAARQLDAAEKSYHQALTISSSHPEALNGLGMIQVERNRVREAFQSFSTALAQHPHYAPALLNQAIVAHLYLNNRPLALQKYSEYLALKPQPANSPAVQRIARQLQIETYPPPQQAANLVASANIATNPVMIRTNSQTANQFASASPAPVTLRSNLLPPSLLAFSSKTNKQTPEAMHTAPKTNGLESSPRFEVVRLPDEITLKPAQATVATANERPTSSKAPMRAEGVPILRYAYAAPSRLLPGNRSKAEPLFSQAVQDHKRRRLAAAIEGYRAATQADPSYFEAYYNLGLAAYESGDLPLSLNAYEHALTLNSKHVSSRYNFALALQQATYLSDAANELEKLLAQSPGEARFHLTLANLYAQGLDRPALARAHYLNVLAKEPNHSQATAIRYWLAANPSP